MPDSTIKYTSCRAIDHFNNGATLMKITGYIDSIEGLKALPKSPSKWIFKCVVNNNDGQRVRILFWGDDVLKFNKELSMYQIIKITGGIIKMANATWRKSGDSVSNMEFQYGNASTLEVLGTFDITNGADDKREKAINYQSIAMEDVGTARGPIMISGWLKDNFRSIVTASGSSYGAGMICTERHRMSDHVSTFTPTPELEEGKKISVEGTVERRGDAFILNTPSMDHISIITGAPQMSEDMEEAVESPSIFGKRGPPDAAEEDNSKKKSKID